MFVCFPEQTGQPLCRVGFSDWIKRAGIPEEVSSLLLLEQQRGETDHEHSPHSDDCWNTELFNTNFNKKMMI